MKGGADRNRMALVATIDEMAGALRPQGAPPHGHRGGALANVSPSQLSAQALVQMLLSNWPDAFPLRQHVNYATAVDIARVNRGFVEENTFPRRRQNLRGAARAAAVVAGDNGPGPGHVNPAAANEGAEAGRPEIAPGNGNDDDATESDPDAPGRGEDDDDGGGGGTGNDGPSPGNGGGPDPGVAGQESYVAPGVHSFDFLETASLLG